ncbi:MAG: DNA repair protein RadC [Acidobacteria bacterium]|nr:DNA repair protein RadC [Acidobacteriota bacterium]
MEADERSLREGHRERLRGRYLENGEASLQDYELLELLLTFAIPRRDTKGLAKLLLERLGSLAGVLEAAPEQLQGVGGIGPSASLLVSLVRPLASRSLAQPARSKVFLRSPEEVAAYFRSRLKGLKEEQVHVAFVNTKNAVLAVECLQEGTVDQSVVYPRKALERALLHKACGVVLVHNHPSGDAQPSQEDRALTRTFAAACRAVGLRFLDHLIIGEGEPYSFRSAGTLDE